MPSSPTRPRSELGARVGGPLPEGGRLSILAPPRTYAVKLTVGGQELQRKRQFDELLSRDLAAFNNMLKERKIQNVIARAP